MGGFYFCPLYFWKNKEKGYINIFTIFYKKILTYKPKIGKIKTQGGSPKWQTKISINLILKMKF